MERVWEEVGLAPLGGTDREVVREKLLDLEALGEQVGGMFVLVPLRAQDPVTGEYVTHGWYMRWQSFVPAGRVAEPDAEPESEDPGAVD